MSFLGRISLLVCVSVALATASGCSPGDTSQVDEEKEPHYVLGNSRYNEMDWPGAIEAFQESLEVNPHSAAAHFRLAELYDTKDPDPAAAIYHYEQYLKLEPNAKNQEVINARVHSCKVLLASDECALPDSPAIQKQLEALVVQNHQLQSQVDMLNGELRDWNSYYASLKAAGTATNNANNNSQPASAASAGLTASPEDISTAPEQTDPASGSARPTALLPSHQPGAPNTLTRARAEVSDTTVNYSSRSPRTHTHVVASGETLASIARKHGLSLTALEEANPHVNPRKLRAGQTIVLPP